jgi:flagellin-like hook-associated protein FlgL
MSVSNIGIDQALLSITGTKAQKNASPQRLPNGHRVSSSQDASANRLAVGQGRRAFSRLQSFHRGLNFLAKQIRFADSAMEQIGELVKEMKAQLKTMVKNFPPYPIGSDERSSQIRGFNAFRKLIDQLTIPPREDRHPQILADPEIAAGGGDWEVEIGDTSPPTTVHNQQVHTGPTGLNIPELPEMASDGEVEATIESLDAASETLESRRAGLGADVQRVEASITYSVHFAEFNLEVQNGDGSAESVEASAVMRSLEVKMTLSSESIQTLTEGQSQFAQLLG